MSLAAYSSVPARPLSLPTTSAGRPILARADLDAYDPSPRRAGGRERFFCPIHGGDHQRSLTVDPETGGYACHACGVKGTLREHWPTASFNQGKPRPVRPLSIEELGRRALSARSRADAERAVRLAAEIPPAAATFLNSAGTLTEALRSPDCPGGAYLRGRGLDPAVAAALGVGYAARNSWPGDHGRRVGRLVYPLADPTTGRVVGALGRLCADPSDEWSDEARATFKGVKQRKLAGCPAGVWPYANLAVAREHHRPVVFVEGPADALALLQHPAVPCAVVALIGTANVLPMASLQGVAGVILALDADASGVKATSKLRVDLAIAGIRVETMPADWLGEGTKDAGELAQRQAHGEPGANEAYDRALAAVAEVCAGVLRPTWDEVRADALMREMLERCSALYDAEPESRRQNVLALSDEAIDEACGARDMAALTAAIAAYEQALCVALSR